jgi:hypothetical protein
LKIKRPAAALTEAIMIENERELFAAIEQFLAAMVAEGYTKEQAAARCHELVTDAWISFRHAAAVQARRNAVRVVGAGDGARS